jgi:hypothetical protein
MIGIGKSLFKSNVKDVSGAALDPSAQAFITAAGITDGTQQRAVNQLVLDLKSANIWTKMKAIYPIVGGSASTHKWNLKDPRDLDAAFRLTFTTGWTHSSTGMIPNGTSAYSDTKLIPSSVLTSMNNHFSHYSRTNTSTINYEFGCQDNSPSATGKSFFGNYYSALNTGRIQIQVLDSNPLTYSETSSLGLLIGSRTANNNSKAYRNGILKATQIITTTGGLPSINYYLGALIYKAPDGTILISYGNRQCAFASIGDGLTDTDASNLYTAVQNYQTNLGRNV